MRVVSVLISDMPLICSKLHARSSRNLHSHPFKNDGIIRRMEMRERLKTYIEETDGLSYTNVGKGAGLSNSAIQKFCTGATNSITIENVEKIARSMEVSLRWLLLGEGEPKSSNGITYMYDRIAPEQQSLAFDILKRMAPDEGEEESAA